MSKSSKFAVLSLTVRQCSMLESVIAGSLAFMARKLAAASSTEEAAFYRTQPQKFLPLQAQFTKAGADAARLNRPQKVKLATDDFLTVLSSLSVHNQGEVLFLHEMPNGAEKSKRLAAFTEWEALKDLLDRADPRINDRSQDAEPDEDDEDVDAAEDTE